MRAMISTLVTMVMLMAAVSNGCRAQTPPHLVDTLGSAIDQTGVVFEPDFRELAPIAAVAVVVQNEIVQLHRPADRFPAVSLDLHAVRCRSENLLKGHLNSEDFMFYYFAEDASSPQHNPIYKRLFEAEPGKRYIFFLTKENGVLRSIGDVGEYSVPVNSGQHRDFKVSSDFGRTLADILLRRGDGTNSAEFAFGLHASARLADKWGSRLYNSELLRELTLDSEPIRAVACRQLAEYYNSQYECLYHLRDDPDETADVKQYAIDTISEELDRDKRIMATIFDLTFPIIGQPDSRKRILEELQCLLTSPNQAVRRSACAALHTYYPRQACGPQGPDAATKNQ
jgi:hypothetical protein